MGEVDAVNRERRVTIAARVPPDLAEAMAELAEAGDRTVSREVFRAIRTHVEMSTVGDSSVEAVGRSSVDDAGASLSSRPQPLTSAAADRIDAPAVEPPQAHRGE